MLTKSTMPAALAAGLVLATGCGGGFHGRGSRGSLPGDLLAAKLKLSPEQKAAVHAAFKRHQPALAARMAAVVEARNAVLDAGMDPAVGADAWRVPQERLAGAIQDLAKEVRGAYLEALPILSESQRTEALGLLKKLHAHAEGMHGRHHAFALRFVASRLELTDAQSASLQVLLDRHKAALEAKRDALHKAMGAAVELASDPAAAQAGLDQRYAAVKEAGFALASEVRAVYLEFYPQLSPAQREAARSLVVDFRNAVDGVRKLALGF